MARERSLSEQKRAFDALRGVQYPRVGDRAHWEGALSKRWQRRAAGVEVVRISSTGQTIWTRFVSERAAKRYGSGHRWERWSDGLYRCSGRRGTGGGEMIYGTLYFDKEIA